MTPDACCRSWPEMDINRGRVLFVMVDSAGKYGDMYRQLFPDLRNATFFVSQSGEPCDCLHSWLSARSPSWRPQGLTTWTFPLAILDSSIRESHWSAAH